MEYPYSVSFLNIIRRKRNTTGTEGASGGEQEENSTGNELHPLFAFRLRSISIDAGSLLAECSLFASFGRHNLKIVS